MKLFVLIIIALIAPLPGSHAQELPAPSEFRRTSPPGAILSNQWSSEVATEVVPRFDLTRRAEAAPARLTLKQAVVAGLQNNPGVEVEKLAPLLAIEQTRGEKSIFDPTFEFSLAKNYSVDPFGSAASPFFQPIQVRRNVDADASLRKLFVTGTQIELSFLNNRFVGSLPNQVLKPQYQPRLSVGLTQPLLRDFGWGLTTIFVRISENREGVSVLDYRSKLARLAQRIVAAYWNVVFAADNVKVQEKGIELANTLLRDSEARVKAGLLPPLVVTEAHAEQARRKEQSIIAIKSLAIAEANLRLVLNIKDQPDGALPRRIAPVETPALAGTTLDRQASLEHALTHRSELQAQMLTLKNRQLQLRYAENQLLPRLDLRASSGLTGIAGDLKPGASSPFPGNYGTSLERLGRADYYNYSVGVVLQVPLGNGAAESKHAQARIELAQENARFRELQNQIVLETEQALAEVESNQERIQAAKLAAQLAEESLRAQEKRFEVGLTTQKDVIDFQTKLIEARGAELLAITDYNKALADLHFAEGRLLESFNIRIADPKREADPWWARF